MSQQKKTRHHRRPQSLGGTNDKRNISLVKQHHHEAWHLLFENMEPDQIAMVINQVFIDPDYVLVPVYVGEGRDNRRQETVDRLTKQIELRCSY